MEIVLYNKGCCNALVAELVYAYASGAYAERLESSSLSQGTNVRYNNVTSSK